MDEGYWFAPKMFGYGATPVTWQGWALTIGLVALAVLTVTRPMPDTAKLAILVALVAGFAAIAIPRTQGGWRWRWGFPPKD